ELFIIDLIAQHDPQSNAQLCALPPRVLSPSPSARVCGDRIAATRDHGVPHERRLRPRENATTDCLVWSMHQVVGVRRWSILAESCPRSWPAPSRPRTAADLQGKRLLPARRLVPLQDAL